MLANLNFGITKIDTNKINKNFPEENFNLIKNKEYAFILSKNKSGFKILENDHIIIFQRSNITNKEEILNELYLENSLDHGEDTSHLIYKIFNKMGVDFHNSIEGSYLIFMYDKKNETFYVFIDKIYSYNIFYLYDDIKKTLIISDDFSELNLFIDGYNIRNEAIIEFLSFGFLPSPKTMFKDLNLLKFGSYLKFSPKVFNIIQYSNSKEVEQKPISAFEFERQFNIALDDTLRGIIKNKNNIGVSLSGGFFSTYCLSFLRLNYNKDIKAYHLVNGNENNIKEISNRFGCYYNEIESKIDMNKLWHLVVYFLKRPFSEISILIKAHLENIAKNDINLFINGYGGEQFFVNKSSPFEIKYQKETDKNHNKDNLSKIVGVNLKREIEIFNNSKSLNKNTNLISKNPNLRDYSFNYFQDGVFETVSPYLNNNNFNLPIKLLEYYGTSTNNKKILFKKISEPFIGNELNSKFNFFNEHSIHKTLQQDIFNFGSQILNSKRFLERNYISIDYVKYILNETFFDKQERLKIICSFVSLEIWSRIFIDNDKEVIRDFI